LNDDVQLMAIRRRHCPALHSLMSTPQRPEKNFGTIGMMANLRGLHKIAHSLK
jgi:hypothetical protein